MRNTWDEEVPDHKPDDCVECKGTGFYKTPYGAPDDGREVEDEDNCYCDCHDPLKGKPPEKGQVITIAGTNMQTRWNGMWWELLP